MDVLLKLTEQFHWNESCCTVIPYKSTKLNACTNTNSRHLWDCTVFLFLTLEHMQGFCSLIRISQLTASIAD